MILEVRVVPYRLYGDGAEVFSGQNFEVFSMVLPCSAGISSVDTRIVNFGCTVWLCPCATFHM